MESFDEKSELLGTLVCAPSPRVSINGCPLPRSLGEIRDFRLRPFGSALSAPAHVDLRFGKHLRVGVYRAQGTRSPKSASDCAASSS